MSHFFAWGVSASASFLPKNAQDWSPLGWTGWISLQSKGLSRVFSNTTVQSINYLVLSFLQSPTLTCIHDCWKNIALTRQTFADKVLSLLFNMLSRLVIAFLPRSNCLLISWLQSTSAVILETPKIKQYLLLIGHELVKNLLAMLEAQIRFLGQEDPLEKEMATHSSILPWRIPWTEEPGRLQSLGLPESDTI